MRVFKAAILLLLGSLAGCLLLELGLRALKSYRFDGVLHLSSSSINNSFDPELGWMSPKGISYSKHDACYGDGVVSYNRDGFRGVPLNEIKASQVVCLLGDSTLQAYQIPDGMHLANLLEGRLKMIDPELRVLSLGVGGYGSLQELMLYEKYCKALKPRALVLVWNENDPTNNDFVAERYYAPSANNMRRRPYLEDGISVMRKPYPLKLWGVEETSLLLRLLNAALVSMLPSKPPYSQAESLSRGLGVSAQIFARLQQDLGRRFILLTKTDGVEVIAVAHSLGVSVATYAPFIESEVCLPRDSHPNLAGHQKMLDALWPKIRELL